MNDVSVLFPLPATVEERGALLSPGALDSSGRELLSEAAFQALLAAARTPVTSKLAVVRVAAGGPVEALGPGIVFEDAMNARESWRVVSFRFDPCAPIRRENPAKCDVQLRLIAQPLFVEPDGRIRDADVTLHLVYRFPGEEGPRLATELLALKSPETTGKPLGVHPVLRKEGIAGLGARAYEAYRKFVLAAVSRATGRLIALMGLRTNRAEPWVFVAGQIMEGARVLIVGQEISGGTHAAQAIDFLGGGAVNPAPPPDAVSTAPFVSRSVSELTEDSARRIAVIGNPRTSALIPSNQADGAHRDCASCHSDTAALLRISDSGSDVSEIDRYLNRPERFSVPDGVTGYPDAEALQVNPWSVRNFGYFNGRPALTLRTVNETAVVAADTNEMLGRRNPSTLACDEAAVWRCILDRKAKRSSEICLDDFCARVAK